ncbi:MAG: recombinase family protein [Rhodospirillaceae bacterium]|nr:recombinase family protein [Rhodospirillaceae bacterium]MBL6930336.1 recombinase family protein [Rhodospirillales bacterium]
MSKPTIRCAIYTRKSTDEGLDQEFNSLDAQYEACANYIASQRHEGWKLVKQRYDDGGISGGTLERPSLKKLLEDIDAGRIQMIVVYKIDRLTRSLADFAKLVERLEASNCSFVSVTQAFNTSSSMGRLTLNVLLSFAQFEREVTAERIRDKIAASKKKGLWMGGVCPLGYDKNHDPQSRTLVVNNEEANRVRTLFGLYDRFGCLRLVEQEAISLKLRSKVHHYRTGRISGGRPFSRGQIYHILRNPIYLGLVRHKDQTYQGQHDAIIDQNLWDRVQEKLAQASRRKRGGTSTNDQSGVFTDQAILTGKIFDETGDRLTPTHTLKNGRKIRYYVSNRLISGGPDPTGLRLSALKFEEHLANIIAGHLETTAANYALTESPNLHGVGSIRKQTAGITVKLRSKGLLQYGDLVEKVCIQQTTVLIKLDGKVLGDKLGLSPDVLSSALVEFDVPWIFRKRGVENKIIVGSPAPEPDQVLIGTLAKAHQWAHEMKNGASPKAIAQRQGVTPGYIRTRSKLAFLSPKIQQAIVKGMLSPEFTTNKIMQMTIPRDWHHQHSLFGL